MTTPKSVLPTPISAVTQPSPPSKRDLASWWSGFKKRTRKEEEKLESPTGIFGVSLAVSIKYANVAISLQNDRGESYVYGYVPIIVAKCGVFLKENGTDVHGIFRLPGSAKRIKDLQALFDSPDRYGRGLDWSGFTVHDAGSIFRRYINALPEPVIPLEYYERYRAPLLKHQKAATADPDLEPDELPADQFDHAATIAKYQQLIKELPALNRQLLLYILDLLAVFSSKSDVNGMDQFNLSAVFQPGVLSHPMHDLKPVEYKLSQNVLVYLIVNQDHFLVGMEGTQVDDKTVEHMKMLPVRRVGNVVTAESQRRSSFIRRTASVSSRNSNLSGTPGSPGPSSPQVTTAGGIHRSNTAPSRRSSALNSPLFSRTPIESPASLRHTPSIGEQNLIPSGTETPSKQLKDSRKEVHTSLEPAHVASTIEETSKVIEITPEKKSKDIKTLFSRSPPTGNKLKKKHRPADAIPSAQSSTHSLHGAPDGAEDDGNRTLTIPELIDAEHANPSELIPPPSILGRAHSPAKSPAMSAHSAAPELSEDERLNDEAIENNGKKRNRWRLSAALKRDHDHPATPAASRLHSPVSTVDRLTPLVSPEKVDAADAREALSDKESESEGREKRGLLSRLKDKVIPSKGETEKEDKTRSDGDKLDIFSGDGSKDDEPIKAVYETEQETVADDGVKPQQESIPHERESRVEELA